MLSKMGILKWSQLTTYVKHLILMVILLNAIKDIQLKMENAIIGNYKDLKIYDAKHGISKNKFVTNAQINGISKKEKVVYLITHYVKRQIIKQEHTLLATQDIKLRMEHVFYLPLQVLQILAVLNGIGITKNVLLALKDGLLTLLEPAHQLMTIVLIMTIMVLVLHATMVINYMMINVTLLILSVNNQMLMDHVNYVTMVMLSIINNLGQSLNQPIFLNTIVNAALKNQLLLKKTTDCDNL